jgi:hypothetical protein
MLIFARPYWDTRWPKVEREPVASLEQVASGRKTHPAPLRPLVLIAMLAALSLAVGAQARPLTTRPQLRLDVRVVITDKRIVLDRHSAPRGVEARFAIRNTGAKAHNFTLRGPKLGTGRRQGFTRTVKPGRRLNVRLFLDVRARQTYFSGLPADRHKRGMRGFFVIR